MDQLRLGALFLGRRIKKGFNLEDFNDQYDWDLFAEKRMILDKLQEAGFFSVQDSHPSPAPTGLAVTDSFSLI